MLTVNKEYILREIGGEYILVATGKAALQFCGLVTLTESGYLLWKHLEAGGAEDKLVSVLLEEYEVDEETAKKDVAEFLENMKANNILIEK